MVAQITLLQAAADAAACAGIGFLVAVLYDGGCCLLGRSGPVRLLLDLAASLAAAVLVCSFSAQHSHSTAVRWYMVAGLVCGLAGYAGVLAPVSRAFQARVKWLLGRPAVLLWLLVLRPLVCLAQKAWAGLCRAWRCKRPESRKKQQEKQLQKYGQILYNSR